MNEDKLTQTIGKAQRASELLNDNQAFNEAVSVVRQQIIDHWETCKDPHERERCWLSIHIVDQIKQAIVTAVAHGNISHRQLDDLASGRARKHFGIV